MSEDKPQTRTEANTPKEAGHLDPGQQSALEKSAEAEHTTGLPKESLIRQAKQEAEDGKPKEGTGNKGA